MGQKTGKKRQKLFFKNAFCDHFQKRETNSKTIFGKIFPCSFLKTILHGQMTEKIAFEVRPKKGKKLQKVPLLKSVFLTTWPLGG